MSGRPLTHTRSALTAVLLLVVAAGCGYGRSATTLTPTDSATSGLVQRIDAYIARLSPEQQIGQTLMLAVYASAYNANLAQALTQWHLGSAVVFTNYNGGPLMPTTLAGMRQLVSDLKAHADTPLLLAIDEEGGLVDRLAFYYGHTSTVTHPRPSSSPLPAIPSRRIEKPRRSPNACERSA